MSTVAAGANRCGVRGEMGEFLRALKHDWPITDAVRVEVVETALRVLRSGASERTLMLAAKVLLAADQINVRRELNESIDHRADSRDRVAALQALHASPEGRALLAQMDRMLPGSQLPKDGKDEQRSASQEQEASFPDQGAPPARADAVRRGEGC